MGMIADSLRFRLRYDKDGGGPESVVGKFASADPKSRATGVCWARRAAATGLHCPTWRPGASGLPRRAWAWRRPGSRSPLPMPSSFGKPIMEHQAVGFRLADLATRLEAARLMVLSAAALKDAAVPCLTQASMAKLFASEAAETITSGAIQTLGGYGYLEDVGLARIYRDMRVCQIYEGTSDIQRMVIARAL